MKTLLVAIHGILTSQTDVSWPDKFDAWLFARAPGVKVLKKEYFAGPFPQWNCSVKDPHLARSLASEIELFLTQPGKDAFHRVTSISLHQSTTPALWFVAHANGAVIALLTAKLLVERGYKIAGMVLTGAACEADLAKSGLLDLIRRGSLNAVIAYSSHDDTVLPGPVRQPPRERKGLGRVVFFFKSAFRKFYSALASPYGSLGRTGLLLDGSPLSGLDTVELRPATLQTRWYRGGHSTYFSSAN